MRASLVLAAAHIALPVLATAGETPRPADARTYVISPADGATVSSPVLVRFGLSGMGVAPAGVEKADTGHHHLLIDVDPAEIDFDNPLPADDNYRHFGVGQTEATIELGSGPHTLRLLLGDQNHTPHAPPLISEPITVTVR